MKKHLLLMALALVVNPIGIVKAQDYLSLSLGYFDVLDDEDALDIRAEYRFDHDIYYGVKPFIGAEVTTDASLWLGAGIYRDFFVNDSVFITPSFGAGYYASGSSDLDLDSALEFRSQIEAGYQFENKDRVSIGLSHISNAGIGSDNPGTEIVSVYYHIGF